jgi:hypothetical protein
MAVGATDGLEHGSVDMPVTIILGLSPFIRPSLQRSKK